jgi:hypothetical protein
MVIILMDRVSRDGFIIVAAIMLWSINLPDHATALPTRQKMESGEKF